MFWIVYGVSLIGCLTLLRVMIKDTLKNNGNIKVGDLTWIIALFLLAIIPVANVVICIVTAIISACVLLDQHKNTVVYKSKKRDD